MWEAPVAMLSELVWKGPQFADMYSLYPFFLVFKVQLGKCPVMPIQLTEAKPINLGATFLAEYHFPWLEWFPKKVTALRYISFL